MHESYETILDELEDDDFDDEELDDEFDEFDDVDLAEVLRDSLADEYADASPEELDDALEYIFESMSPAEAFNFGKALSQIERGASQILTDPAVAQVAKTTLPIAGGAVGTLVGGPVAGTAIGTSLGSAAAKALPAGRPKAPPRPGTASIAAGSPAAAQGLVLTQQPQVLQSLLSLALGQHGRQSVNGVPVGAVMNLLSSVFGQAAADADALLDEADW